MELTLIADKVMRGKIYPAFARHQAEPYTQSWREFDRHWPNTVPFRLQEYFEHHGGNLRVVTLEDAWPKNSFYPIGLGFFNFETDYFDLLPERVRSELFWGNIRLLFYYHEGDNPADIKQRLDALVSHHQMPQDCYVFVSGNTAAKNLKQFVYFSDFELWYWHRNHNVPALEIHHRPREHEFTALIRLHKPWRAMTMADLHRHGVLDRSLWSYCEAVDPETDLNSSPIEVDSIETLRWDTSKFLAGTPYECDNLTDAERNNHSVVEPKYHVDSYCNIVFESQFDVDQSGGVFVTEKTFKPIKHGQMFFVLGAAGTLQHLRDQGYRVFDGVLDNSYDQEKHNTERWLKLRSAIQAAQPVLPELFDRARPDIEHNQQLFQSLKTDRLNILLEQLNESY